MVGEGLCSCNPSFLLKKKSSITYSKELYSTNYHGFAVISSLSHYTITCYRLQAFAKDMSARELCYLGDVLSW